MALADALALADSRNRAIRMARASTDEQEAGLKAARAQRWPTLELRQRYTRLDPDTVARANAASDFLSEALEVEIPPFLYEDNFRTEAEVLLPLWTSGALTAAVDAQLQSVEASTAEEDASRRRTRTQVAGGFFAAVATEDVLRARRAALDRAERRLAEAERRLEIGLNTRQEVLRWRVSVEAALADEAAAEAQRLIERAALASLLDMSAPDLGRLKLPDSPLVDRLLEWADGINVEETLDLARPELELLPEVRAADALAGAAEENVRRVRAGLWPRVDGALSIGYLENDTLALDEFMDYSASLVLSIPIDARGEVRAQVGAARARAQIARIARSDVLAAVEVELIGALAGVIRTRTRLRSARRALEESTERRELLANQQEVGLAGLLDLLDADATLAASDEALALARSEFLASVATLELVWTGADPPRGGLIP